MQSKLIRDALHLLRRFARESIIKRSRICELARKCASADCSARANRSICEGALHLLCEQGVYPTKTLRSKSDKAAILVKFRQRIHYIFSFLRVLRRLENIVCRSRFYWRYSFRFLYIDTYICSLGNIPQAVCVHAAKATSNTPYFLRALHEKQLLTVFPSLTPEVHQKKKSQALCLAFLFFGCAEQGLEGRAAQSELPVDVRDRGRPGRDVCEANSSEMLCISCVDSRENRLPLGSTKKQKQGF